MNFELWETIMWQEYREKRAYRISNDYPGVTEKRLLSFTGSFKKSLSDPYYSGYIERHFDLTALSKLIKPLYKDVKGITLWVYSPFLD
mmetsp:Transcript_33102/g.43594  ORF Transcript_33102/g.43594 Transcript_33102/m.43594 type:complete len:88 (+) Transcript_33102:466-729(+)